MADEAVGKCLEKLANCEIFNLPNLELPPWTPSPSFLAKIRAQSLGTRPSLGQELKKKIANCLDCPPRKYKMPPLTTSSVLSELSPIPVGAYFSMGDNTLKVPMILFSENRRRLAEELSKSNDIPKGAIVLLQGGDSLNLYSTDVEYIFRQEPYFNWAFGVREPGCFGAIVVETGESILFVPRLPESYATWNGPLKTLCNFKQIYDTHKVQYVDQILNTVQGLIEHY